MADTSPRGLRQGERLFALCTIPYWIEIRAGKHPPRLRTSRSRFGAKQEGNQHPAFDRLGNFIGNRGTRPKDCQVSLELTRFDGGRVLGTIPTNTFRRLTRVSLEKGGLTEIIGKAHSRLLKALSEAEPEAAPPTWQAVGRALFGENPTVVVVPPGGYGYRVNYILDEAPPAPDPAAIDDPEDGE